MVACDVRAFAFVVVFATLAAPVLRDAFATGAGPAQWAAALLWCWFALNAAGLVVGARAQGGEPE